MNIMGREKILIKFLKIYYPIIRIYPKKFYYPNPEIRWMLIITLIILQPLKIIKKGRTRRIRSEKEKRKEMSEGGCERIIPSFIAKFPTCIRDERVTIVGGWVGTMGIL